MADSFVEVTNKGFFQRLMSSFGGMIVGVVLFFGAFFVLYWNEGRTDLSVIAKTAIAIPANAAQADANSDGKLVSVAGKLVGNTSIGDNVFIKSGHYLKLSRSVEMFAWVEHKKSETHKKFGGGEETRTTYTYSKEWTDDPENSSNFKISEGHINPEQIIKNETFVVESGKLGDFVLNFNSLDLPATKKLTLNDDIVIQPAINGDEGQPSRVGDKIYIGRSTLQNPQIGDARVSFEFIPSGIDVTVFAKRNGNSLEAFSDEQNNTLFRAFTGNAEQAIKTLHGEYVMMGWIFRVVGLVMMWMGMSLFLGPISTFLDIVPFLGSIGRGLIGVVTFLIALALTVVTVIVSMIAHNLIAIAIAAAIVLIAAAILIKKKAAKSPATLAQV